MPSFLVWKYGAKAGLIANHWSNLKLSITTKNTFLPSRNCGATTRFTSSWDNMGRSSSLANQCSYSAEMNLPKSSLASFFWVANTLLSPSSGLSSSFISQLNNFL